MAHRGAVTTTDDAAPSAPVYPIPLHEFLALGYEVDDGPTGTAVVRMPVRREALGFTGSLHGGAIATMVDLACALAAVRSTSFDASKESLVTVDMHVRYLGRARTDTVEARSEVVRVGRQLIVVTCRVGDSDDNLIAVADFSMMIVPLRTPADAPDGNGNGHGARDGQLRLSGDG